MKNSKNKEIEEIHNNEENPTNEENSINEDFDTLEKPSKRKVNYIQTDKRKEAFEKAR